MSRYINADELIFIGLDNPDDDHLFEFVPREFIDNAPTADVAPMVHGEWVKDEEKSKKLIESIYICSACHNFEAWGETEKYNYCPNCGARMDGEA